MPFTPFHMGPGILIKSLLQGSFSLLLFGFTQVLMDLQPLFAIITGIGNLHGFSHTYIGATLIGIISGLLGKYIFDFIFKYRKIKVVLSWKITFISAFIGSYSHIVLDSIMHSDMNPFYPLEISNNLLYILSNQQLHDFCLISGVIGFVLYEIIKRYK
ncbi:uncharacterized protein METZ01_LOCUS367237 [marine metagenome]|uniref:Hydrolase n=1 Tax=marine metagenome TaxID=408172 RepID=A0A382SXC4_9ZZZZ